MKGIDRTASGFIGAPKRLRAGMLLAGTILTFGGAFPALAQTAADASPPGQAGAVSPPPAANATEAQQPTALGDIVVTARRVEERLQDVPLSVTALGKSALADSQISQLSDLKAQVSNLITIKSGTPGAAYLALRGQVSGQLPSLTLDNRVGTYLDGVYIARAQGGSFTLADIERVEVLKGPQGTLYGHNVTGGAINFVTSHPTGKFDGTLEAGFGNLGRQRYRASVDLPEWKGFSLHFGYVHDALDGDVRNLAAGRTYGPFVNQAAGFDIQVGPAAKRLNGFNNDSYFAALRYDGIDGLTIDYKFDYADNLQGANSGQVIGFAGTFVGCAGAALALGVAPSCPAPAGIDPRAGLTLPFPITSAAANQVVVNFRKQNAIANDQTAMSHTVNQGHSLTIKYEAADNLTFKSITGYRKLRTGDSEDTDGGDYYIINNIYNALPLSVGLPAGTLPAGGVTPYCVSCSVQAQHQHQFSEEFQTLGKVGNFDLLGGLYYFKERGQIVNFFDANYNPVLAAFGAGIPPLTSGSNFVPNSAFSNGDLETARSKSEAVFGRVTWHATDKLDLVVGARYTHDAKHNTINEVLQEAVGPIDSAGDLSPLDARVHFNKFTYEGTVTYKITPDVNIFARYTTAYLAGGLFKNQEFRPETAKDVEAGIKSEFFDRRVRFNLVGFAQDSKNLQVNGIVGAAGAIVIQNVGKSKTRGFEAELAAVPAQGLTLNANIGYTHQWYSDGRRNIAPPWSIALGGSYDAPKFANGSFIEASIDGNYTSRFWAGAPYSLLDPRSGNDGTPLPAEVWAGYATQDAYLEALDKHMSDGGYWLANIRLSLADIPLGGTKARISGFARNLFNKKGRVAVNNYGTAVMANYEQDRTYGVDLRVAF